MPPIRYRSLILAFGALAGLISVALDALGAHALGSSPDPARLHLLDLATKYQLIHAVALVGIAALQGRPDDRPPSGWLTASALALMAGIVLFCGGLALHAIANVTTFRPVVPVGGTALLLGWALLLVHALRVRA